MRIVTYGGATSLDGFLAGPGGSLDWLHFSPDVQRITADYWKTIDTVLMGRKTYDVSKAQMPPRKRSGRRAATPRSRLRTYVFSRTLRGIDDDPDVELVRGDAVDFVRGLKQSRGRNICLMGGGDLAQSLLAADLIDEIGLNIHPVILGRGVPAFRDPGQRLAFELRECIQIAGGCVLVRYRRTSGGNGLGGG